MQRLLPGPEEGSVGTRQRGWSSRKINKKNFPFIIVLLIQRVKEAIAGRTRKVPHSQKKNQKKKSCSGGKKKKHNGGRKQNQTTWNNSLWHEGCSHQKSNSHSKQQREISANNPRTCCKYNSDSTFNGKKAKTKRKGPKTHRRGEKNPKQKNPPESDCLSFNI